MTNVIRISHLVLIAVCCKVSPAEEANILFSVSIPENQEAGVFIGNIATGSHVLENASLSENQKAKFTYLKESATNNDYFELDYDTGDLNTSDTRIDRESVCDYPETCTMTLEIAVTSGKFFAIVTANIFILDVNDNTPTFSNGVTNLDIFEDETVKTEFRIGTAFDADISDINSIQGYVIEQEEELFELIAVKGNDKTYSFSLRLLKELDREKKDNYKVKVIVSDGGDPVLRGTLEINVNVMDDNDNTPVFSSNGYNRTIDENIPKDTVILTISATDLDIGVNSQISYRIRERQSNIDTIKRLFHLEETSGKLSVISDFTREPSEYYRFFVDATDNGSVSLMNHTVVMVTVNDVENSAPTIELNLLSPGKIRFVDIEENQPNEVFVAHVNVEDYDKGDNGKFICDIKNNLFTLEKFQGRGFKVVVDGLLDRESKSIHNVTVECQDLGTPPEASAETFFVRVLDVNDNDPKFDETIYTATKTENNKINDTITTVHATDMDVGLNGTIEYMILENSEQFRIDNESGVIYANRSFDREHEGLIVLRVIAVDHGPSRRTGTTTVSLTLIDENDNPPVMIPTRPELRIRENQAANTSLGFLYAEDNDSGVNAMFTFAFTPVQKTFPFTLTSNGEILTKEVLDRERQNRYEIPVTVTDMGEKQLSNIQYITIFIKDDNDNYPKVTFPNDINDTVKFIYPVGVYNVVTTVAAYDVDEGENGTLRFQITGGNELDIFEIDPDLGEVSIKKYIDIKDDLIVSLIIEIEDRASVPKVTSVTLKIELIYANSTRVVPVPGTAENKYIIISVVVIVTTVAVAIAIVGAILFIRSVDNRKQREDVSGGYSDSGISSNADSLPPDGDMTENSADKSKKKKEVSFSLEFSLDGLDGGRNVETNTDEYVQNRYYDSPPTTIQHGPPLYSLQNQNKIDNHMKALKLQQYLWEAKSRVWENSPVHQIPVGDSGSESSRDTVTCDSGRGGSEDDVSIPSPVAEEKRFFSIQDPKPKHIQFLPQQKYAQSSLPTVRESTPVHHANPPPRPTSYRICNTDSQNHNPRLTIKNFTNPTYSSQNDQIQQMNQRQSLHQPDPWQDYYQQHGDKYYPRMRHDSGSSLRSNEDDGGSTTTSGSYTLDENHLDIVDIYPNQRDLVV